MSNKQFTSKYLELVEKLMNFIVDNGKGVNELPKDASFVAFSSKNSELNKYSEKILESLIKEHPNKPIIKAVEHSLPDSWEFTSIAP